MFGLRSKQKQVNYKTQIGDVRTIKTNMKTFILNKNTKRGVLELANINDTEDVIKEFTLDTPTSKIIMDAGFNKPGVALVQSIDNHYQLPKSYLLYDGVVLL